MNQHSSLYMTCADNTNIIQISDPCQSLNLEMLILKEMRCMGQCTELTPLVSLLWALLAPFLL